MARSFHVQYGARSGLARAHVSVEDPLDRSTRSLPCARRTVNVIEATRVPSPMERPASRNGVQRAPWAGGNEEAYVLSRVAERTILMLDRRCRVWGVRSGAGPALRGCGRPIARLHPLHLRCGRERCARKSFRRPCATAPARTTAEPPSNSRRAASSQSGISKAPAQGGHQPIARPPACFTTYPGHPSEHT